MRTMFRRILLAAAIPAAVAASAVAAVPAQAQGVFNLWETNGSQAAGANDPANGNPVIEVNHPGRDMTFQMVGTTSGGVAYGYLRLNVNGNIVSAVSSGPGACRNVTLKGLETSDGTVVYATPHSNQWFSFRHCGGVDVARLSGANVNGAQLRICGGSQGLSCNGRLYNWTLH